MKKDLSIIQEMLQRHFDVIDLEVDGSRILRSNQKLSLIKLLRSICENQDDEDRVGWDYPEILSELKIGEDSLLEFEYQSVGPMVFSHSLVKYDFGDQNFYIVQYVDGDDPEIISGIDKDGYPILLPEFLRTYYSSNGSHYSDHEMFGSLPSETTICDPTITIELQKECYRLFLDGILERYPDHSSWFGEQEDMMSVFETPNVMERSLKLMSQLPSLDEATEFLMEHTIAKEDGLAQINEKVKDNILTLLIYYKTKVSVLGQD